MMLKLILQSLVKFRLVLFSYNYSDNVFFMFHSVVTVTLCTVLHSNLLYYVQVKHYREATCKTSTGKVQ